MTELESIKVYELAKELGLDSISLLEKLKGLNIKVKSHMSDLTQNQVQAARHSLGKKSSPAILSKVRKKIVPKIPAPETTVDPLKEIAVSDKKSANSPIIRRRAKTETALAPIETTTPELPHPEIIEPDSYAQPDTPIQAEPLETQIQTQPETLSPVVPTADPKTPLRKSILKIVEPKTPTRPTVIEQAKPVGTSISTKTAVKGTTTHQDKDGFRIIKMTKENLDQMLEEESAKKRAGGRLASDIAPEDVRFADYRKKEIVFLPKKKKIPPGKELKRTVKTTPKAIKRIVQMQETIGIQDLATQLNVKIPDVLKKLISLGQMATIQSHLDLDTATLVANEYQFEVKNIAFNEETWLAFAEDKPEDLKPRPPIVTIMGHVDHGKTSLLDAIRETHVAAGEAGGITQHIGAYTVEKNGKQITFIDTPGHEAFTSMRARGANTTDIVILVVAADDGVMPQTREALAHAQAAQVPVLVAINKIDKPGANPEKIKQALSELNLLPEDWGGQTIFVPVSALQKTNLDKLLESILLQAEIMDLKANPTGRASGIVLESRLDKGRGPVVTLLVKRGTLKVGEPIVSGALAGKVKAMQNDKGQVVKEVPPGIAAEILGFSAIPKAGDPFVVTSLEAEAEKIAEHRKFLEKAKSELLNYSKVTLDNLFSKIQAGRTKELNVILKGDTFGSIEAIRESLEKTGTEKVKVKVIHSGAGGITESDVLLASASNALIIGFNVRPDTKARQLAEGEHIEVKCYTIIYELLEDVKNAMVGLLDKKKIETFLGRAEIKQVFTVPKAGAIAGSSVVDGKFIRGANVRLLRDSKIVFEGKMSSLKRFKDDAKEVSTGLECGIGIENYNDLKPGDIIEAYQVEWVNAELTA